MSIGNRVISGRGNGARSIGAMASGFGAGWISGLGAGWIGGRGAGWIGDCAWAGVTGGLGADGAGLGPTGGVGGVGGVPPLLGGAAGGFGAALFRAR